MDQKLKKIVTFPYEGSNKVSHSSLGKAFRDIGESILGNFTMDENLKKLIMLYKEGIHKT
jgi:hypothetical protein